MKKFKIISKIKQICFGFIRLANQRFETAAWNGLSIKPPSLSLAVSMLRTPLPSTSLIKCLRTKCACLGFTMAEAVLVMTILGIIATIMITTMKPAKFKEKGPVLLLLLPGKFD